MTRKELVEHLEAVPAAAEITALDLNGVQWIVRGPAPCGSLFGCHTFRKPEAGEHQRHPISRIMEVQKPVESQTK